MKPTSGVPGAGWGMPDLWGAPQPTSGVPKLQAHAKADLWGGATQKMEEMTHEHAENIQ